MTSRRAGQRISSLSAGKRVTASRPAGRTGKPGQQKMSGREKRKLAQLAACGIIFAGMVAVKLLLPAKMDLIRTKLQPVMEQNLDVAEVFSAVGRAFSGEQDLGQTMDSVYQAVFHNQENEAVEAAANLSGTVEIPLPAQSERLRAFAEDRGSSTAWDLSPAQQETTASQATQSSDADAATPQQAADTAEDAAAVRLTNVLYSGKNLPENVSMEQEILGFDYCTPVMGTLSSNFGYREHPIEGEELFHYGLDLAADTGTEIDAFADGTVSAVGESSSYGKYLMIAHESGYMTLYAHCSKVVVSSGTAVTEGQKIAEVGETGMATGPHLHFELHSGEEYLNPVYYVSTT